MTMADKDWWYLIATIASPFLAAGLTAYITLLWQNRKEKRDLKMRVFSSLMAVRRNMGNFQFAQEWVRSLNMIDIAFADEPEVLKIWRELYPMLQQTVEPPGQGHKNIEMMWAMAKCLGIKNLSQTDIDKGHCPGAISNPINKANELSAELLRVLKNTERVVVEPVPAPPSVPAARRVMPPPG
jgi:hypothetical protein